MFESTGEVRGSWLYELTSPRTVQAFMVVLFSLVVCVMSLRGEAVPELAGWALAAIIGYYFGSVNERKPVEVNGPSAMRIADYVRSQLLAPVKAVKLEPVPVSAKEFVPVPVVIGGEDAVDSAVT